MNFKKKGNKFEREILKSLSLWLSNGERSDLLRRSMLSGGRTTQSLKKGKTEYLEQAGDGALAAYHPVVVRFLEVFLLEFKFYKDLRVDQLIWGSFADNSNLVSFWRRVCKDALRIGRQPFLIAKQNAKFELLFINSESLYFFNRKWEDMKSLGPLATIYPNDFVKGYGFSETFHVFPFPIFLKKAKFDSNLD